MDHGRRAGLYLALTDEAPGDAAPDQRSMTRRLVATAAALLVLGSPGLAVATAAQGPTDPDPVVLTKSGEDDHDDAREDGGDGSGGAGPQDGDGTTTGGTRTPATDRPAAPTGPPTAGGTDPGDATAPTERP